MIGMCRRTDLFLRLIISPVLDERYEQAVHDGKEIQHRKKQQPDRKGAEQETSRQKEKRQEQVAGLPALRQDQEQVPSGLRDGTGLEESVHDAPVAVKDQLEKEVRYSQNQAGNQQDSERKGSPFFFQNEIRDKLYDPEIDDRESRSSPLARATTPKTLTPLQERQRFQGNHRLGFLRHPSMLRCI